ncbi:MAG: hypothetical protein U0572_00370 [Phycisphaerales bacterium]
MNLERAMSIPASHRPALRRTRRFGTLLAACIAIVLVTTGARASTDTFAIGLDQPVSNGVPGPGAGSIETLGAIDVYSFRAAPGTAVFFDEIWTNNGNIAWKLLDPSGATIFSSYFDGIDPGTLTLAGGTYTVRVEIPDGNSTGQYQFILATSASYQYFAIGLDQAVSNGNPAPGAGIIESFGQVDFYAVDVPPGTAVFFDEIWTNNGNIAWKLLDPSGATIFSSYFDGIDPGTLTLAGGTYTIRVEIPDGNSTGQYQFILATSASYQSFAIGLDQAVSNGNPAPGAGIIESFGQVDFYAVDVAPGTAVFFDEIWTNNGNIAWKLLDPSGATIFSSYFDGIDPGTLTLAGGTYTIRVEIPDGNSTGQYQFILATSASYQSFAIGLDQAVSNGNPAPGAGIIESFGQVDFYAVDVPPGTAVFFDEIWTNNGNIAWKLLDPSGATIFSSYFDGIDPGTLTLAGGTYTIRVEIPDGNSTGQYQFILATSASYQSFAIGLDQAVSNGNPAPGAGIIESFGQVDFYAVDVAPGTAVFFDEIWTNNGNIAWKLLDPSGATIFSSYFDGIDPGTLTLAGGTYTVRVEIPDGNSTGQYQFILATSASYQYFNLGYGEPVFDGYPGPGAGSIGSRAQVDFYSLTADEGDVAIFNEIWTNNGNIVWTLFDPAGATVFSQPFGGPDPGTFTLHAGTYTIRVEEPGGNSTGQYSFAVCTDRSPDLDCDGHVNAADLGLLLGAWGGPGPLGDLDRDGIVGPLDLGILLGGWSG